MMIMKAVQVLMLCFILVVHKIIAQDIPPQTPIIGILTQAHMNTTTQFNKKIIEFTTTFLSDINSKYMCINNVLKQTTRGNKLLKIIQ